MIYVTVHKIKNMSGLHFLDYEMLGTQNMAGYILHVLLNHLDINCLSKCQLLVCSMMYVNSQTRVTVQNYLVF